MDQDSFSRCGYDDVRELTWGNSEARPGGPLPDIQTKPTWVSADETLESIVHQAACEECHLKPQLYHQNHADNPSPTVFASSHVLSPENQTVPEIAAGFCQCPLGNLGCWDFQGEYVNHKASASASATATPMFSWDKTTTITNYDDDDTSMRRTWDSLKSPSSFKTKTTYDDPICYGESENPDEAIHVKRKTISPSQLTRRSRIASIHNQSERRRRERINQKIKTLQELVPNASETNKASMLDEVINYLKQLQTQVQMMNAIRNNMPQMMSPLLGLHHQHLQMSYLAQMGMSIGGVGLGTDSGMHNMNLIARPSVSQSFSRVLHPATSQLVPLPYPYNTFIAQAMNIEMYNKMAELHRQ